MKRVIFLSIFFIYFNTESLEAQALEWDYPIKPGTSAWNNLKTVDERFRYCMIDESIIKSISTENLVYICMNHPFFRSFVASDSPYWGIINGFREFNGYSELISRPDGIKTIMSVYISQNFDTLSEVIDRVERGRITLTWVGLEMMMCNDDAILKLSQEERISFLKKLLYKYEEKTKYLEDFGGIGTGVTVFLGRKIMKSLGYKDVNINQDDISKYNFFDKTLLLWDISLLDKMLNECKTFCKNLN